MRCRLRDYDYDIAVERRITRRPPDNAKDPCPALVSQIDRPDQVDADLALGVPSTDRKDQQRVGFGSA